LLFGYFLVELFVRFIVNLNIWMSSSSCSSDEGESDDGRIILTIDGDQYDVTDYVPAHPGEGHNDIFLEDYHGQDVTKEFHYYHEKKQTTMEIIDKVKEKGKYQKILLIKNDQQNGKK